ncbi:MAG: DUF1350 family protein, partial [Microcystaceae cyanobacterium]
TVAMTRLLTFDWLSQIIKGIYASGQSLDAVLQSALLRKPLMGNTRAQNQLIPLPHGLVSFHPQPEGIVHFIGGYFFGTGVNCWYNSLLEQLAERFTVHAYSYSFTQLSHWKIASDLLEQIELVKVEGRRVAKQWGAQAEVYDNPSQHCLVGHSLGCECVALIRLLSLPKEQQLQLLKDAYNELGAKEVTHLDWADVEALPQLQPVPYQASLVMAPCFKTPTAISSLLDVRPGRQLVRYLIEYEPTLLPRTSLISFKGDTIAGGQEGACGSTNPCDVQSTGGVKSPCGDVSWVEQTLQQQGHLIDFQEINVCNAWWVALQYHMIPAFAPLKSGLSGYAADLISVLERKDVDLKP